MSMKKVNGFVLSFLIGGTVGSVLALLYAPKSGRNLRKDISNKTNELIEDGRKLTYDTWNGAKDAAGHTFETANDFLNTGVEKIVNKTEKIKDAFKSGIDSFKDERKSKKDKSGLYEEDVENIHSRIT